MSNHKQKNKGLTRNNIILINTLLIAGIVVGIGWGIKVYFKLNKSEYTNDAQVEEYIAPVNTRVGGYIKTISFTDHQPVKKGDTLIVIDDRELKIAQEQAEAAYINARAAEKLSYSGVNTVKNNIGVSDANIAAARARLWNAENNFKRYVNLLQDDVVTRQQFEQVKTEYDAMKAQFDALLKQRQSAALSAVEAGNRIGMNEAEIKRAKAALDMARLNVSYTVIRAPYDGVVGRRTIQEGQLVQPGQSMLFIVRGSQRWIVANYKETQIERLHIGQLMKVTIDALNHKVYKGKITAISQATGAKYSTIPVDNSTGNFVKVQQRIPVRIEFTSDNDEASLGKLRAGMNAEIESL